jgi:transposase
MRAGVEGTASYGAALNRTVRGEGITVIEVNRPDRAERRRRGKTDATDAEAAARAVLSGRATAVAKAGDGPVEIARMFKLAKSSAVKSRTQAINQLKAVLVGADPALREQLSASASESVENDRRTDRPRGSPRLLKELPRLVTHTRQEGMRSPRAGMQLA